MNQEAIRGTQPKPLRPLRLNCWVIGHRGAPKMAPENTLPAFQAAIDVGVDMIEFDVTLTRDRVPIVIHDRALKRTTDSRGAVRRRTFSALRKLDAGSWFSDEFVDVRIPTLNEVLEVASGNVALNIEIKREAVSRRIVGGIEEKVLFALMKHGIQAQSVISSFSSLAIRRITEIDPAQSVALLMRRVPRRNPRAILRQIPADALHLPLQGLNRAVIRQAHEEGIPIRVYTVNDRSDMKRLLHWGVDGMFTDRPERLLKLRV